jgi:hypothetical protein
MAMRNGLLVVAAILFVTDSSFAQETSTAPQTPAEAVPVMKLADATPVLLRTKEALSSATAKVGDRVAFRVTEDVKAGELIAIQRGAEAWGTVTAVQPKARKGKAGSLDVAIQSVQLLSGENAALRAEQHSKGAGSSMGLDMLQAASSGILLPVVPFLLLEKGKDVVLPTGTKFTAYVNGDVPLDRTTFEKVQPVIAKLSGPATVTIFRAKWPAATVYKPSVYCGKIALARLPYNGYVKIQLPPGKYSFMSNDDQVVELRLEEGQEAYLQMDIVTHGLKVKGHLTQVSSSDGKEELASLYELNSNDVAKVSGAALADLQAMPE